VLAGCYAIVRLADLAYLVAARYDPRLRRQLLLTAVPVAAASGLLVAGGALGTALPDRAVGTGPRARVAEESVPVTIAYWVR